MQFDTIYLVYYDYYCYHETNRGEFGYPIKIFKSKQKAIDYIVSERGKAPCNDPDDEFYNRLVIDLSGTGCGYDVEEFRLVELPLVFDD